MMLLLSLLCLSGIAMAQSGSIDSAASDRLTKYLHKNRLPMVGAQVSNTSSGRQLMLFGYVATDFGKADAVGKSTRFLHEPNIRVINNIQVDPQVRHLKKHAPKDQGPVDMGESNRPPRANWENTFDDTLRSGGATPSNDPSLSMPPPAGPAPAPRGSSW
jgi:hypothetical protein